MPRDHSRSYKGPTNDKPLVPAWMDDPSPPLLKAPAAMDTDKIKLMAKNEGLRETLLRIQSAAADENNDSDALKLAAQLEFIRGTAEDALKLWA